MISRPLAGWCCVNAGYLGPRVRRYGDQPQDEQQQQDQQHPEEPPNRTPLLCGSGGPRCPWSACPPTRSAWRAGRWDAWARMWGLVGRGARVRRAPLLWRGGPVWVRHHTCPFGLRLLGIAPVQPVEILIAAGRHVSKGTRAESRFVGVASAPKGCGPNILAAIFPGFLPRQQTERLPRCQFAPRMLHRARRPRCPHASSEANASRDAEAWPFWP